MPSVGSPDLRGAARSAAEESETRSLSTSWDVFSSSSGSGLDAGSLGDMSSSSNACTMKQQSAYNTLIVTASSSCKSYSWTDIAIDKPSTKLCECASLVKQSSIPECLVDTDGIDLMLPDKHRSLLSQCQASDSGTTSIGSLVGLAGGAIVAMLIIGYILWGRDRTKDQEPKNTEVADVAAMPSPARYTPVDVTPRDSRPKKASNQHGSYQSEPSHATVSTADTSAHASGTGSRGSRKSDQQSSVSDRGSTWNDPVIVAARVPRDAVFFGPLISRGGYGEVFRGTYMGETVAIKQLLPARRKDLKQIDDFLGEVKLMSGLEHERIVRFIGVAWNSLSDACLIVEYMENGDLRSVLTRWDEGVDQRSTGFDTDKVTIAMHVAHALTYLHSMQPVVVHRDLKSKNVLLDENLDAKLTDFGISRERADFTMTAGVGSSLWMAPEVMMGERYNEKADVFSFGVVLSELDTHQLPYFHARMTETGQKMPETAILQQVMLGRLSVRFTDHADPALVELGRECVNLDPKARPTAAQVLHRVYKALQSLRQAAALV